VTGLTTIAILARRDVVRAFRQPARAAAVIGTPILIWILLGAGFAGAFAPGGSQPSEDYGAFLLPGMMALVALFAAIMAAIALIDDRNAGWLQGVIVAPVPRWSIASGRVAGAMIIAWIQSGLLLMAAPTVGISLTLSSMLTLIALSGITSLALTALGVAIAMRCHSTASFHSAMNLIFMPMWLLSGAIFPIDSAVPWLATIMTINPLSWPVTAMSSAIAGHLDMTSTVLAVSWAIAMLIAATCSMRR